MSKESEQNIDQKSPLRLSDLFTNRTPAEVAEAMLTMAKVANVPLEKPLGNPDHPYTVNQVAGILQNRIGRDLMVPGYFEPTDAKEHPQYVTDNMEAAIWNGVVDLQLTQESLRDRIQVRINDLVNEAKGIDSVGDQNSGKTLSLVSKVSDNLRFVADTAKEKMRNVFSVVNQKIENRKDTSELHEKSDEYVGLLKNQFAIGGEVVVDPGMGHDTNTVFDAQLVSKRKFVNIPLNYAAPDADKVVALQVGNHKLDNTSVNLGEVDNAMSEVVKIRSFEANLKLVSLREARLQAEIDATPAAYQTDVRNAVADEIALLKYLRYSLLDGKVSVAEGDQRFSLADLDRYAESTISLSKIKQKLTGGAISLAVVLSACGGTAPTKSPEIISAETPVVLASPTTTVESTAVAAPSPTMAPAGNVENLNGEFNIDSLNPFSTYVVISQNGLSEATYGKGVDQLTDEQKNELSVLEQSMVGQMADAITKFPNPGKKYYIPAFIDTNDLRNSLTAAGQDPEAYNLTSFDDLSGATVHTDGILMSVHLGEGGWDIVGWDDFKMAQNKDGVYYVDGLLSLGINSDADSGYENYSLVRGQRLGTDVVGALPVITEEGRFVVKVDTNGKVVEVMSNTGFVEGDDNPWLLPSEVGNELLANPTESANIHNIGAPAEAEIENVFKESGLDFPEALTTSYEDSFYSYDLRLSKNFMHKTGKDNFQLPPEMASKLAYQTLGEVMYLFYYNYPEFKNAVPDVNSNNGINGLTNYQNLAMEAIKEGPLQLDHATSALFTGQIVGLQVDMVTETEFNTFKADLDRKNIAYADYKSRVEDNTYDGNSLIFITNEGKMAIVSFYNGENNPTLVDPNKPPTSEQFFGNTNINYFSSIINDYDHALLMVKPMLMKKNGPSTVSQSDTKKYICPTPELGQSIDDACAQLVNDAFTPLDTISE